MENKLEVLNYVTNLKGLSNAPNSDEISLNPYTDLLNSEFSQMMNGAIPSEPRELVKGMTKLKISNTYTYSSTLEHGRKITKFKLLQQHFCKKTQ